MPTHRTEFDIPAMVWLAEDRSTGRRLRAAAAPEASDPGAGGTW